MQGDLRQDYLVGSPIARQMIVGMHAGYHGVSVADLASGEFAASLNAGTSGTGPGGARRDEVTPAASTVVQPTASIAKMHLPSLGSRSSDLSGRSLQATPSAALANPLLLFAPSGSASLTLEVFFAPASGGSAGWVVLANCSSASIFAPAAACARVDTSIFPPSSSIPGTVASSYLRVRVPARFTASLAVIAAPRATGVAADAPYLVLLGVGDVPTSVNTTAAAALGSGESFSVPNCLYSPVDAYLAG